MRHSATESQGPNQTAHWQQRSVVITYNPIFVFLCKFLTRFELGSSENESNEPSHSAAATTGNARTRLKLRIEKFSLRSRTQPSKAELVVLLIERSNHAIEQFDQSKVFLARGVCRMERWLASHLEEHLPTDVENLYKSQQIMAGFEDTTSIKAFYDSSSCGQLIFTRPSCI